MPTGFNLERAASGPSFHEVNLSAPRALASLPCPPPAPAAFLQRAKVLQELMLHAYTSLNPLGISLETGRSASTIFNP